MTASNVIQLDWPVYLISDEIDGIEILTCVVLPTGAVVTPEDI